MSNRLVSCDKDLTMLTILNKSGNPTYLSYNEIAHIRIGYATQKKFFFKKTTEKIEIMPKGSKKPIILTKPMDWDHFEQYKQEISRFARENRIEFLTFG